MTLGHEQIKLDKIFFVQAHVVHCCCLNVIFLKNRYCLGAPSARMQSEDIITNEVWRRNANWLGRLFRSHGGIAVRLRVPGELCGHVYTVDRPVLGTRLGEYIPIPAAPAGSLCGGNGGRTQKGTACRRKGTRPGGRCAQHPHISIIPHASAGEQLRRAEVTFGDDSAIRPIGSEISWIRCQIIVPTIDVPLTPVDLVDADPLCLTTCTRVWEEHILRFKAMLNAPCEATLAFAGTELPVEPIWTVEMLWDRYPELPLSIVNGRVLREGYLLADYGVAAGSLGTADKKQE